MASFRGALLCTVPRMLSSNPASHAICRPVLGSFSRFYSSNGTAKSIDIDLSSEESKRRLFNSLLYRSKQRGFLELDLILGKWVEDHIYSMDESGIKNLVLFLDLENPDLWKWLTDQEKPPETVNLNPVFMASREKVINNLNNHAAPETRAVPGQPWSRGWDDFNKGLVPEQGKYDYETLCFRVAILYTRNLKSVRVIQYPSCIIGFFYGCARHFWSVFKFFHGSLRLALLTSITLGCNYMCSRNCVWCLDSMSIGIMFRIPFDA